MKRLNIKLDEGDAHKLERLKQHTGLMHNTEIVRYCITKAFKETFDNDK